MAEKKKSSGRRAARSIDEQIADLEQKKQARLQERLDRNIAQLEVAIEQLTASRQRTNRVRERALELYGGVQSIAEELDVDLPDEWLAKIRDPETLPAEQQSDDSEDSADDTTENQDD